MNLTLPAAAGIGLACFLVSACGDPVPSSAQPKEAQATRPYQAVITAASRGTVSVETVEGDRITLTPDPKTVILEATPSTIAAIRSNSFVGATAHEGRKGYLIASEVHIFDESLRGLGEGHRAAPSSGDNSMTNGTIQSTARRTGQTAAPRAGGAGSMTNGDVTATTSNAMGQVIVVTYKGGQQRIIVPSNVPVTRLTRGTPELLRKGALVAVIPDPKGGTVPVAIKVGRGNLMPSL